MIKVSKFFVCKPTS